MSDKIKRLLETASRQSKDDSSAGSSISHASRKLSAPDEATTCFYRFREKLFHVERWNAHSSITTFKLYDSGGKIKGVQRAEVGDFIQITLTGSGKPDWVKIVEIYDGKFEIIITVQPSLDPTDNKSADKDAGDKSAVVSHFFTDEARNNFCLVKNENALDMYVIGLNELTNTENTEGVLETVRNFATSNIGHYLGVQQYEWKTFCENFLKDNDK